MWPTVHAHIDSDLCVHVTIAGVTRTMRAQTLTEARDLARTQIGSWAKHFGRPMTVSVTDPEGTWTIEVDSEGIAVDTTTMPKRHWWTPKTERKTRA